MANRALLTRSCIIALVITACADTGFAPENTNHAPRFAHQPPLEVLHDQQYTYNVAVTDDDGDVVVIGAPEHPTWLALDSVDMVLSGIAGEANIGDHPVKLTASDGHTITTLQFTVVVSPNLASLRFDGSWVPAGFWFGHDTLTYESDNFIVHSGFSRPEEREYVATVLEDCFVELQASLDITNHDEFEYPSTGTDIDVLTLKHQGNDVLWTGQSYRYGLIVHAPDSPRYATEGYTRPLYRQLLKHELMHVTEYLLIGTDGDYTSTEKWLHEGIATYLGGTPPNQVTRDHQVQAWQDAMRNFSGGGNPISIKTWSDFPNEFTADAEVLGEYYMFFELAVRYLVDPQGHGRSVVDIKNMYLDIRRGDSFTQAFQNRMGLSVSQYEEDFFEIMMQYLK